MLRTICKGKIHRATVTEAALHYVGSITIDRALMDAANIRPYEMVQINNCSNASTWRTYALPADRGSGKVCLNGPPARLFQPMDQVIILSLAEVTDEEYERTTTHVVFVDGQNHIARIEAHCLSDMLERHSPEV